MNQIKIYIYMFIDRFLLQKTVSGNSNYIRIDELHTNRQNQGESITLPA